MKVTKFGRLEELVSPEELEQENIVSEAKNFDEPDEDTKEKMRAFAHQQLSKSHPHIHKKYKHYD